MKTTKHVKSFKTKFDERPTYFKYSQKCIVIIPTRKETIVNPFCANVPIDTTFITTCNILEL